MNIFIAGGGRVGFHLARLLTIEGHDVSIIESDMNRVEQTDYALDAQTITGNATSAILLKEAGVGDADVFVAVTRGDEENLIAAATAKGLGAKQVVARVDNHDYIHSSILYETILSIDYVLSPEALTALEIARFIDNPGMVAAEDFGRGLVQMRQVRVSKSPTTGGKALKDVFPPRSGVLLGMISRNGSTHIPHGDSIVAAGDLITIIGHKDQIPEVLKQFQGVMTQAETIVIMGGGNIGLHLAQLLDNKQRSVKLLDWDMSRCNALSSKLKRVQVVCRDGTTRSTMEQERVDKADLFVAATGDDENNIMASVLAKEVGVEHTVAVVHQPDFAQLVYRLGIDHAFTPRASFANRLLRLVHMKDVSTLAVLDEGQVEILEVNVASNAPITQGTLYDNRNRFPDGALVGAILREDTVIVPGGDDRIQSGDSVVLIARTESIEAARRLFLG